MPPQNTPLAPLPARLIGIDVGTTAVKALLFDAAGTALERYHAPCPIRRDGTGGVEQDADAWVTRVLAALERFAARHDLSTVAGIGLCSQVNTHVFVDAAGEALAPALVWQDGRAAAAAAEIDATLANAERLAWWGAPLPVDASHALARLRWLRTSRPAIHARTRHVLLPKDYCLLKLTGELVSDPISNIGLVDGALNYIEPLLDREPGAAMRLPPLADPTDVLARVRPGLPGAGLPVAVGTMDGWAGMFGVGANAPGDAVYLGGTSEILGIVSPELQPTPGVLVFPLWRGRRVHMAPTQSGGAAIEWYCRAFGTTPEAMAASVSARPPGRPCPLFLPHLEGERAPIWDAHSRGTFLGVTSSTDAADFAAAVYEGVAHAARWLLETLETSADRRVDTLRCGGGGFRSPVWNRLRADVTGKRLRVLAVDDPGVLGAAALAAVASGLHGTLESALDGLVRFADTLEPSPADRARRDERFALYRETWEATRGLNRRLLALDTSA